MIPIIAPRSVVRTAPKFPFGTYRSFPALSLTRHGNFLPASRVQ